MEKTYEIKNLGCAHCGGKIEEAIKNLDGIDDAVLNFPMRKIRIKGNVTGSMLEEINRIANKIEAGVIITLPDNKKNKHNPEHKHEHEHHHGDCCCGHEHGHEHEHHHDECCCGHEHGHGHEHHHDECCCGHEHGHEHSHEQEHNHGQEKNIVRQIIPLAVGIVLFITAIAVSRFSDIKLVSLILFAVSYLVLGYNVIINTFKNIRSGNFFDENFLMTVATLGAFALGEYTEAVGVVLFFKIGEMFEDIAVARSRKAITAVADLKVDEAEVLRNGEFVRIDADEIEVGDILRIKTGERIAADGIVESGNSRIDTSAVNGEPVPVAVHAGDSVLSGCINLSDTFTLRATAPASESMISRIAQAVENASSEKPKIDRFITRFSKIYTPFVIVAAVLTAVLGSLITGDIQKWIYSALTFLVISCPCALVLSVPLAYFSGIGAASKMGILFKGGESIEALGKVKAVVFDKTGTLTNGSFTVTNIRTSGNMSENELMRICGSCEQVSSHPVAGSITAECSRRGISLTVPEQSGELAGRGIYAVLDGKNVLCGNEKLMKEKNIILPDMPEAGIGSVVYVAVNGSIAGRIIVSDSVKKTSAEAVSKLKNMGLYTSMLTGDKPENAEATGKTIGIDYSAGGLMPEDKLNELNRIRREKGAVMFVGDGINDAPVLAGADIGGAMQTGSDLALEAADAVFMSSEPESVVSAKKIADKTLRISYQNIIFALAVKALVLVLGVLGHPNMWLAVFADSGTAMLLILNSIRVLNTKKYRNI
ncbi:MAG: cadmium-translocating P-type ATPase [Ruminococcus sp.]|nr:cadmium-translocating P-type ATPase [Ruminococcus sp.]